MALRIYNNRLTVLDKEIFNITNYPISFVVGTVHLLQCGYVLSIFVDPLYVIGAHIIIPA